MAKRRQVGLNGPQGNRNVSEQRTAGIGSITPDDTGNLRLSDIRFLAPGTLTDSPYNEPFRALKDPQYMERLRRDIEEAGEITEPLLITPDNEIVSGHSRRDVALQLGFSRVPVRIIQSELSESDKKTRVYLANLSRFEIDIDTRNILYAEIYPDYFQGENAGKPGKRDTRSRITVAQDMGVSERTAARERAIFQEAAAVAQKEGRKAPQVSDVKEARKKQAQKRKAPGKAPQRPATRSKAQEPFEVLQEVSVDDPSDGITQDYFKRFGSRWTEKVNRGEDTFTAGEVSSMLSELVQEIFDAIAITRDTGLQEKAPADYFTALHQLVVTMQERGVTSYDGAIDDLIESLRDTKNV